MSNYITFAKSEDAVEIAKMEKEFFSSPWSENAILSEINAPDSVFLVSKKNNNITGYISGRDIAGEFYINNIAVKKEFRRQGTAFLLLSGIVNSAKERNCEFITLEVRASNYPAIALYKKTGFEFLGERKNFYSNPKENAAIYTFFFNKRI
ncbi:MAG: ribosomal protein S18-alanine N-acetyltransferase [Oscillospiraceae bacterium]|nr:ribosomal protein S18-alanine N-acetyltransferase [Oscillospiraceae bacterium]